MVNFVKKLKQWIKTTGQEYSKKSKKNLKTVDYNNASSNNATIASKNTSKNASKASSKAASPSKQNQKHAQDIFDKLRLKNDSSPVNSVLMRDNPSPIHLFEKLSINPPPKAAATEDKHEQMEKVFSNEELLFNAIEKFALGLKSLKINRCVIREAINKA